MKSKIVLNILIIYFLLLSFVLLVQVSSKEINAVEPLSNEITAKDRLKNAVVLYLDSPLTIINEKQFLIDKEDTTISPIVYNGKVYIPAVLLKTAYKANITFSKVNKETTVRLDNKAIIFYNDNNKIRVIDNTSEESLELEDNSKIINDRFYIPLNTFAEIFKKEVFYSDNLIIISNIKNLINPIEEIELIGSIIKQVKYLPAVGNEENLKYLIYSNKSVGKKNEPENIFLTNKEKNTETDKSYIIKKFENYNFYIREGVLEVYYVNNLKKEEFLLRLEIEENLVDIFIKGNILGLTYYSENEEYGNTSNVIYDISDVNNIKLINKFKNNGRFYKNVLHSNYLYSFSKLDAKLADNLRKNILPRFNNGFNEFEDIVPLDKIYYFPDVNDKEFTLITSFNINNPQDLVQNYVYFGMGENIVFNNEYVYIATEKGNKTNIYLFKLSLGKFEFSKRIYIKGNINDFSENIIKENDDIITITEKSSLKEYLFTKELDDL